MGHSPPPTNELWFEALEDGCQIALNDFLDKLDVKYSFDKVNWTPFEHDEDGFGIFVDVPTGQKIYCRGNNPEGFNGNESNLEKFSGQGKFNVGGKLMYLLNENGEDVNELPEGAFRWLFASEGTSGYNVDIVDASELILPDYVSESCYSYVFAGCTNLTQAPELPATTLVGNCYGNMFSGCTSLITAPELPATTLAANCYGNMFSGCTSLITAPELPATTLAITCYRSMFEGCISLTQAPELPATTLVGGCYHYMFQGCTNLSNVTCLAEAGFNNSISGWLSNVSPTGTFTRSENSDWTQWLMGIPENWNIIPPFPQPLDGSVILTAIENGSTVFIRKFGSCDARVWYKKGNKIGDLIGLSHRVSLNSGESIIVYGMHGSNYSNSNYLQFVMSGKLQASGNIMSLYDYTNLDIDTIGYSYCFYKLFSDCTSLTSAPELPATTLANSCYYYMFQGCTGLEIAPELPATTLASGCYDSMFKGCTKLSNVTCLAEENIDVNNSTTDWLNNVSSTGTFTKSSNATWPSGVNGIPSGWTVINKE